jgi:DNA-binding CsgD family transcriptional regulator/catechol 2,3-dioxygenase-like lactoylglutathione lyase family enzyme
MAMQKQRGRPPHTDQLTPAEWRIVDGIRHGMTSRVIAELRGISTDAVKYHVTNILQKLDLKNRTELRHWDGIARDSILYSKGTDMDAGWKIGAIGQISRQVKDIEAARLWYGDVLGLTHLYSFGDLAFFDCDGTRLFLSQGEGTHQGESIIYFQVKDIRSSHSSLAAHGVEFMNAPHMVHRHDDGTEEWMAFFKDNENRPLALMAQLRI